MSRTRISSLAKARAIQPAENPPEAAPSPRIFPSPVRPSTRSSGSATVHSSCSARAARRWSSASRLRPSGPVTRIRPQSPPHPVSLRRLARHTRPPVRPRPLSFLSRSSHPHPSTSRRSSRPPHPSTSRRSSHQPGYRPYSFGSECLLVPAAGRCRCAGLAGVQRERCGPAAVGR